MKKTGTYRCTRIDAFNLPKGEGMYDGIADFLNGADMYSHVLIPLPQDLDERTACNRINTALNRYYIELPEEGALMKRVCWVDSERVIQVIVMPVS